MPSFYTGDELGNIKHIYCFENSSETETNDSEESRWKVEDKIVLKAVNLPESTKKESRVEKLSSGKFFKQTVLAVARSSGSVEIVSSENDSGKFEVAREWKGKKPVHGQSCFVGMSLLPNGAFWCTSNGALSYAKSSSDESSLFSEDLERCSLPMNLRSWQLSPDAKSFCYGGNEVDASLWDTTKAFSGSGPSDGKKRSRNDELFPAELWRAKNLPNDNLNLRQPIKITSIAFLSSSTNQASSSFAHLVTGTELGDVRRYDTRAARKPVANWVGLRKGGVGSVKTGLREHELFVSDNGSNLSAVDLRNGRVLYSYKRIQGSMTDFVPSSSFLASTSHDRFFRLHSTAPPPEVAGQQQIERGDVLNSLYMKSIPTAVVTDPLDVERTDIGSSTSLPVEEDPWEGLQSVSDEEDDGEKPRKIHRR